MARRAAARGYLTVFSPPPPPSNTFESPPGGTAVLVARPLVLRKLEVPETCEKEGRLVCTLLSHFSTSFILISIYGYPPNHPMRANNEVMFRHVATWMMSLSLPALAAGDWIEAVDSSLFLSLLPSFGLWKLNSSCPTTHGKTRRIAEGLAIHHAIVNSRFLDHHPSMEVSYARQVSDHYPLEGRWMCIKESFMSWSWPTPMKIEGKPRHVIAWEGKCDTFVEWEAKATKWIAQAYEIPAKSKSLHSASVWKPKLLPSDTRYLTILSAMRALNTILHTTNPSARQKCSLARKLAEFDIPLEPIEHVHKRLQEALHSGAPITREEVYPRKNPENQFSVELFKACASKRTWATSGGRGVCFFGAPTNMECLLPVLWGKDSQVRHSLDESYLCPGLLHLLRKHCLR